MSISTSARASKRREPAIGAIFMTVTLTGSVSTSAPPAPRARPSTSWVVALDELVVVALDELVVVALDALVVVAIVDHSARDHRL